jgi:hypothetical protein
VRTGNKTEVPPLHEQVFTAWKTTGWTVAQFLDKSRLKITRSVLHRKLKGEATMRTTEAEVLVSTLRENGVDVTIVWPVLTRPKPSRRKRAA